MDERTTMALFALIVIVGGMAVIAVAATIENVPVLAEAWDRLVRRFRGW